MAWLRASVSVDIAADSSFDRSYFEDVWSVLDGSFTHGDGRSVDVPNGQTVVVAMQSIATGGLLFIKTDRQVKLLLSRGADVDQVVTVGIAADEPGALMLMGEWDAVKLQNDSGADALVMIGFAGNP